MKDLKREKPDIFGVFFVGFFNYEKGKIGNDYKAVKTAKWD
jgi:hypothetical protein